VASRIGTPSKLRLTSGAGVSAPQGKEVALEAPEGPVAALYRWFVDAKPGREAWFCGARFTGDYRSAENWRNQQALPVDVDYEPGGMHMKMPDDVAANARLALEVLPGNLAYLTPRGFRVVFVLREPLADRYATGAALRGAANLIGAALARAGLHDFKVDRKALDLARLMFTPNAQVNGTQRSAEVVIARFELHDAEDLVAAAPGAADTAPARPSRILNRVPTNLDAMLAHIDAEDYDTWIKVGMALKREYGDAALDAWDKWSSSSEKWDPRETWPKLESFRREAGNVITLGTVIHLAREGGWDSGRSTRGSEVFDPIDEPPSEAAWVVPAHEAAAGRQGTRFLVHGVLPARGLAQVFGAPSSGKTPYAVHLTLTVATGLPTWFGHDVDRRGAVVYMAGEDLSGVLDRLAAQLDALDPSLRLTDVPVCVTTRPGRLVDAKDAVRWVKEIRGALKKAGWEPSCVLLVVDTQARCFGPGNENSTEDMSAFIDNTEALSRALGCLVLLIHHSGHRETGRGRGASALPAALDAQFEVQRTGLNVVATCHKAKNWAEPPPLAGRLAPVQIGEDERGRPVTAITLDDKPPYQVVFDNDGDETMEVRRLLAAVFEVGGKPTSQKELAELAGLTYKQLRARDKRARELELIEVTPGKGRAKPTYALTPSGLAMHNHGQDDVDDLLS
jgi:hypothetical protein